LELPAQAWRAAAVYVEYRLWPLKLAMHPFGWEWQYGHAQEPPYLLIKPEPWVRSLLEIAMRHWSRAHPVEDAKDLDRSAWFAWLEEVCRRKGLPWVWYGRPGLE
jgi:hypothetical protein